MDSFNPTFYDANYTLTSTTERVNTLHTDHSTKSAPYDVEHESTSTVDIVDTSHINTLIIIFLLKIGWTNNVFSLLFPLHITTMQEITTSIPIQKID